MGWYRAGWPLFCLLATTTCGKKAAGPNVDGRGPTDNDAGADATTAGDDAGVADQPGGRGDGADVDPPGETGDAGEAGDAGGPTAFELLKIGAAPARWIFASPDEKHIAASAFDPMFTGCDSIGPIADVDVYSLDDRIPRRVGGFRTAGLTQVGFSADSRWFVHLDHLAFRLCTAMGTMGVYAIDTETGVIRSYGLADLLDHLTINGAGAVWRKRFMYPGIVVGPEDHLGVRVGVANATILSPGEVARVSLDPSGTLAYVARKTATELVSLSVTPDKRVTLATEPIGSAVWARSGSHFAVIRSLTADSNQLRLFSRDGTALGEVAASCRCRFVRFLGEGTQLAYDMVDAQGSRMVVHPITGGGPDVILTYGAEDAPDVEQPGPRSGVAVDDDADGRRIGFHVSDDGGDRLLVADPGRNGSFHSFRFPFNIRSYSFSPAGDRVAIETLTASSATELWIGRLADGQLQRLPFSGQLMGYQETGPSPKLAVLLGASPDIHQGKLVVLPPDGSGTGIEISDNVDSRAAKGKAIAPRWVGRFLVFSRPRVPQPAEPVEGFDLYAGDSSSGQATLLGSGVAAIATRATGAPLRLFFGAAAAGGGLFAARFPAE